MPPTMKPAGRNIRLTPIVTSAAPEICKTVAKITAYTNTCGTISSILPAVALS